MTRREFSENLSKICLSGKCPVEKEYCPFMYLHECLNNTPEDWEGAFDLDPDLEATIRDRADLSSFQKSKPLLDWSYTTTRYMVVFEKTPNICNGFAEYALWDMARVGIGYVYLPTTEPNPKRLRAYFTEEEPKEGECYPLAVKTRVKNKFAVYESEVNSDAMVGFTFDLKKVNFPDKIFLSIVGED